MPAVPRAAPWFAALVFAGLVGLSETINWISLMGFLGAAPSGTRDPVFGKDLSFYLLALPWYEAVVGTLITVLLITIAVWGFCGLAFFPKSGRPWHQSGFRFGSAHRPPLRLVAADATDPPTPAEQIWEDWLR
jgi:hypothetical protein